MKCPVNIVKLARIVLEDIEDYLRQNIPDDREKEVKNLIAEKLQSNVLLRHPILTLGIGDMGRRRNAVKSVGEMLMEKYPRMRYTQRNNRQEDDRIIKNVMMALSEIDAQNRKKDRTKRNVKSIGVNVVKDLARVSF